LPRSRAFASLRGRASSRRKTAWAPGPFNTAPELMNSAGVSLWNQGAQAVDAGLTIVRIRGSFTIWQTLATTAGDGFNDCALGICIVTENAFGVGGVAAIPSPLTDIGWGGWLYHRVIGPLITLSVTEEAISGLSMARIQIDTKAMRKVKETDIVVGMVELGMEQGNSQVEYAVNTRMLSKLP